MHQFQLSKLSLCIALLTPLSTWADSVIASDNTLETMLVEGEQYKLQLEKDIALNPGGVTLIDAEDLSERNVSNLSDMLRYVPGMWVASGSTGDSSFFSSRGSNLDATAYDGNGIKLLQDGLPVTAADGNNHNRGVDPLSARFAVVARGANALTYGASTLGGAINFVSPTAHDMESQALLNGGSHGQVQGRLTLSGVSGDLDGLVTVEAKRWDGFRSQHHEQEREGLYANAGWKINEQLNTRFYLTSISNDQNLPGALTAEQFEQDPYQANANSALGNFQLDVDTWRIANKTSWQLNEDSQLTLGVSYEEQSLFHPIVYNPFFSLLIDTDQDNTGLSLRYNMTAGDHDLLLGMNYGESNVTGGNYFHDKGTRGNLMTIVDNHADSMELFALDRWQLTPEWTMVYGLQAVSAGREVRNTNAATGVLYNPSDDFNSINPRAGVIYQWSDNSELFANISRLYEPPTNFELEDDASRDSSALEAMSGEVLEIGSRGRSAIGTDSSMHWELALYYGQLNDEILSVDDPSAPGTSLSANVDSTIHAGIEAMMGASFALGDSGDHRLEPLVNITVNEFSFDDDPVYGNNQLPAAPGYAVKGELLYRHSGGFFIGPTFDIVDDRYADFTNTYQVDSYTLLGLRAGLSGKTWEVYADARNLTDKDYVSLFSVRNQAGSDAAILQAGEPRSVYVGLTLNF